MPLEEYTVCDISACVTILALVGSGPVMAMVSDLLAVNPLHFMRYDVCWIERWQFSHGSDFLSYLVPDKV
jgi:hypothetical protein